MATNEERPRRIKPAFRRRTNTTTFTANERLLLNMIRSEGPVSRADLARRTDLALQSIVRLVDGLMERGYVAKTGEKVIRGPGQPSLPIALVAQSAFTVGVSVTRDMTYLVLVDLSGQNLASSRIAADGSDPIALVPLLRAAIDQLAADAVIDRQRLFGIGVATTGYFVDNATLNTPKAMGDWALRDLEADLSEALDLPVWVENDGNAAAVGESLYGAGQRYRYFAYIYIASGLGGGVIVDGRPMRGFHGNAGEFTGLLPVASRENRPHLASLFALLQANGVNVVDIGDMVERFDMSWPGVDTWVERTREVLNAIVSAIGAILDPEAIVIGGRIPRVLAERLVAEASYFAAPLRDRERPFPALLAAQAVGDAAALGAASIPLHEHFFG